MCKSLDTGFIFLTLKGEKFEGVFFLLLCRSCLELYYFILQQF